MDLCANAKVGELADWLDGRLSSEEAASLEAHLDVCETCRLAVSVTLKAFVSPGDELVDDDGGLLPLGASIDRYVIDALLGAGAMGVVYRAYDPALDRFVALKVVRPAMAEGHQQRLLQEAQAIARIAHPNVVSIYDVGEAGARVFLAMELIEGGPVSAWSAAVPRDWRVIVDVFVQAGQGLAAVHAANLVHRDVKPDNVLVGDDGRVRISDLGLAIAMGGADRGTRAGTPAYMSPEQAGGAPASLLSDQWAYCTSFLEVLGRAAGDSPPRGVLRVLQRGHAAEPAARWPSMAALLDALVVATQRRRRVRSGVGIAALVALASAGLFVLQQDPCSDAARALAGTWNDARREVVLQAFAATGSTDATEMFAAFAAGIDAQARAWTAQRVEACEATHVRHTQSDEALDLRMRCLDDRREELAALIALHEHIDSSSAATVLPRAVEAARALPPVSGCSDLVALRAPLPLPLDVDTRARIHAVRARLAHVTALRVSGRYTEALELSEALFIDAGAIGYAPVEAAILSLRGEVQRVSGDARAAEATLLRAIAVADSGRCDDVRATAWSSLVGVVGRDAARFDENEKLVVLARAAAARLTQPTAALAELDWELGAIYAMQARTADATAALERARAAHETLGDDVGLAADLASLGNVAVLDSHPAQAKPLYERALLLDEAIFGATHPRLATHLDNLGNVAWATGDNAQAHRLHARALGIRERVFGPVHSSVMNSLINLANIDQSDGRFDDAERTYRRALAIGEQTIGVEHPTMALCHLNLGSLLADARRPADALVELRAALSIQDKVLGAGHPDTAATIASIGMVFFDEGKHDDAVEHLTRATRLLEAARGAAHVELAEPLLALGRAYTALGQRVKARTVLARARDIAHSSAEIRADLRDEIDAADAALTR